MFVGSLEPVKHTNGQRTPQCVRSWSDSFHDHRPRRLLPDGGPQRSKLQRKRPGALNVLDLTTISETSCSAPALQSRLVHCAKLASHLKIAPLSICRRAANGAQPSDAAPSEREDITGGTTQPRMPSLADYMGAGSSSPATAAPRQQQRQELDDRQHAQHPQHQADFGKDAGYGQNSGHQYWQSEPGWQREQAEPDGWPEQHRQRHDQHRQPQDAHWQRPAPQHPQRQEWDPRTWVDHDAAGGRDAWVDHDAAGGRDAWVDHDAAGGRDGWVDHDAMGGRGSWHSHERSGGASTDVATHYSAPAGRPGGPEAAPPQGADSEPESGEVEAEEGELQPSPAKRQRVDEGASDDGGWT